MEGATHHDVSVSESSTVTVTKDEDGNVTSSTLTTTEGSTVTVDGVTYEKNTNSELDLDNPYDSVSKGTEITVHEGSGLDMNNTHLEATKGDITVEKGAPTDTEATVEVPAGCQAKIGEQTYDGGIKLTVDAEGNVTELGYKTDGLKLQRDENGAIASNGKLNQSERLQPEFEATVRVSASASIRRSDCPGI